MTQRTCLFVKPDGLARGLVGEITSRCERRGLKLIACKMRWLSTSEAAAHYAELKERNFFQELVEYVTLTPVVVQCWEGPDAVSVVRRMVGATNGRIADPGTIRGDLSISVQANVVHASDSEKAASEELGRFFDAGELFSYATPPQASMLSMDETRNR